MTVLDLTALTLAVGKHAPGSDEMCLLEAVAYIAGESWSDHPVCVSSVLGMYGRDLNDALPDETRQRLVPFIPRLLNTAGDGLDGRRSYLALDWVTRTYLPAWLRLVPSLTGQADLLSAAPEVTDLATATRVGVLVREVKLQVAAARGAALGAARYAAGYAAGYAALDAARGVALDAAQAAAAWDAAHDAAGYAARDAARDAGYGAGYGAVEAVWDAIWVSAVSAAWIAAEEGVGGSLDTILASTVTALQDSAIDLFDRMLTVTNGGL